MSPVLSELSYYPLIGHLTPEAMFLASKQFDGDDVANVYKPNNMIHMHEQKVYVRLNFRADTLEYVEGWKKKNKIDTVRSNSTTNRDNVKGSSSSRRSVHSDSTQSNEVEVYFPARETRIFADFKSNGKRPDDAYANARSLKSWKETGR